MDLEQAHSNMIKQQILTCEVQEESIIAVLYAVAREQFVPAHMKNLAYADMPLAIGHGQNMFCPKEEAQLLQSLDIKATDSVLEVGTGTGYMTAVLAKLASKVVSVDIFADFTRQAQERLRQFDVDNVTLATGNAAMGWETEAAYDVVVITGSLAKVPAVFDAQVNIGGRLFAVLGEAPSMQACVFTKIAKQQWRAQRLFETTVARLLKTHEASLFVF